MEQEDSQKLSVTDMAQKNTEKDFGAKKTGPADPGSPELPSILKKIRHEEDDDAAGAGIPRLFGKIPKKNSNHRTEFFDNYRKPFSVQFQLLIRIFDDTEVSIVGK